MMPPAIPRATYRVQLSSEFGLAQAAALVPYLHALGVSHLYASPFLKSRPGSTHGYDIVDHNQIDPELGGDSGLSELSKALAGADMGLILDFVPNHMGIGHSDNAWWLDVLEWGPASPYAATFDIDWDLLPFRTHAGVLLPILAKPYGQALEAGDIELRFNPDEGSFSAWYFDHRLPIRIDRYADIIGTAVRTAGAEQTATGRAYLDVVKHRAPARRDAPAFKAALAAVNGGTLIEAGLSTYRAISGDPRSVAALHRLLERQHYRLAHWRVAVSEINYRRFFDINDLAGIRIERTSTFRAVHQLVFRLVGEERLHGIRLDHIDGLYDPSLYCRHLQRGLRASRNGAKTKIYTVAEKILAEGETFPNFAGVSGTTGYDVLNDIARVMLDPRGLPILDRTLTEITESDRTFGAEVEDCKRLVINSILASEFRVLVQLLARIAAGHWSSRDFTVDRLRAALESYVTRFPVYRTYVTGRAVNVQDRARIVGAIEQARLHWSGPDGDIFRFLQHVLTLNIVSEPRSGYSRPRVRRFAMKLQQFTGPVMAKAVEDTAFYRYHRLLALNEVGGDPVNPELGIAEFHARMTDRAWRNPHAMNATATHDTKRGEDARMRILALSELADDWSLAVRQWLDKHRQMLYEDRQPAPSRAHQYMIYQALLGAWPLARIDDSFVERITAYAIKAAREGKVATSWATPDTHYEAALAGYVKAILEPAGNVDFLKSFSELAQRAALIGALSSLSQLALKLMLPGVPDIYQGTEFWDLSLVDPDNRRPVAFDDRLRTLAWFEGALPWQELCADWRSGRIKLALMRTLLSLRRQRPLHFAQGEYAGLSVAGPNADKVIAFARIYRRTCIVVAARRHFRDVIGDGIAWPPSVHCNASIDLPAWPSFRDLLDPVAQGELRGTTHASRLFGRLPVAVLIST